MQFASLLRLLVGASALFCLLSPASAEVPEIRLARQFSMGYLQLNVMEHEKLIEKHAKALGIPEVKVSWFTFNGPTAVNEALISGNIDVGSGGVPGLLTLWARSKGTPQEARHFSAEFAALPAQLAGPRHQDYQGFQGQRSHCAAGGAIVGAGNHCKWRRPRHSVSRNSPSSTR